MYKPRLADKYKDEVAPALKNQFSYKSVMQVPRLKKIVLNQGLGSAVADKRMIETAEITLEFIFMITSKSKKLIENNYIYMIEPSETDLKDDEWNGSINSVKDYIKKEQNKLS